jgi:membrane protein implicated in regulation of membrane protease activity
MEINFLGLLKSQMSFLMCGFNIAATLFGIMMMFILSWYFVLSVILHLVLSIFFYYHAKYMAEKESES